MSNLPQKLESMVLDLPGFKTMPPISLDISTLKEAERRLIEAKDVSPVTYGTLEYCFNESWRMLSQHLAIVGDAILRTEQELDRSKGLAVLDKYPEFIKDKPKMDNADTRKAFITMDVDVVAARERLDQLKVLEMFLDSRCKVMERTCAYMKKRIDLIQRSGLSNTKLY